MTSKAGFAVVIDYAIYLYCLGPVARGLAEAGQRVDVFRSKGVAKLVDEELADVAGIRIWDLEPILRRHRLRYAVNRSLQILFTRPDFSYQYRKRFEHTTKAYTGVRRTLMRLAPFMPKVANSRINAFIDFWTGVGFRSPFGVRRVVAASLNSCSHLLTARNQHVTTIVESWDHPVKEPNGYLSDAVYAWNDGLADDWKENQYDRNVRIWYPAKLRYAIEQTAWLHDGSPSVPPVCVYAVAGTSRFSVRPLVDLERRIIADLVEATSQAGWRLHIKPRPNGTSAEFDDVVSANSHVSAGNINGVLTETPANYYLDDAYNAARFGELKGAALVVNCLTTFGLDAALAGFDVAQLDLREAEGYESSRLFYGNYHIRKYLMGAPGVYHIKGDLKQALVRILSGDRRQTTIHAQYIRDWLVPDGRTFLEATKELVGDMVAGTS